MSTALRNSTCLAPAAPTSPIHTADGAHGTTARKARSHPRRLVACLAAVSLALLLGATPALADFGIASFDGSLTDQAGSPFTQAGGHPYLDSVSIGLPTTTDPSGTTIPDGNVKDIHVSLPVGFAGNPQVVPACTLDQLFNGAQPFAACPVGSQVGVVHLFGPFSTFGVIDFGYIPVYSLTPPPGSPAAFGFNAAGLENVILTAKVRSGGDYGIDIDSDNISQVLPLTRIDLSFWGVPADPSHDNQRCASPARSGACTGTPGNVVNGPNAAGVPASPFLRLPTSCVGPQPTTINADSWQDPGHFKTASFVWRDSGGNPTGATGCNRLDFSPSITVQLDTSLADSPAGVSVDLRLPQDNNPDGLAEADLQDASVTLPAGVSVDPSSANGLMACSPSQIGLNNASEPSCPDASKIGSVQVDTPLLRDPLTGGIYVAQQDNNPFGSLLAIYVTAEADGVLVKLAGHVVADPVTGQLETTFSNNPQLPFSDFKLDFFGGARGVLATPEGCGTYTTNSSFTPWSGTPPVTSSDSFEITSGCVSGFSPSFTAGTQNPQAGSFSPFVLSFSRSDTDQNFSGLSVKLPPGMLARLAGVQECTDAQLAATAAKTGSQEQQSPSCPAGSQVGTVMTGAGTGPDPFFLGGKAYLTGPYKGAPYGLAVVVPAVAGPYDLGTVVVRQALYVDPETAQVTAVSDPFPTILQGIPLGLRRVEVNLNRPNFTVNPTSCNPTSIGGVVSSTGGLSAPVSSRFQVGGCQELGFSPKLKMSLTGKGRTRSGQHPNLVSTVTMPSGQANISNVKVALPLSLALDPNNSQHVCDYDTAQAVHGGPVGCSASTIVGSATAYTPLLSQPLSGPVYLVQGIRFGPQGQRIHTLPSLLVPLRGQIALDVRAQSSVSRGQLVTTFPTIPDAAVSKFVLTINGGSKGILVITGRGKSICGKLQITNADFGAQSGKVENSNVKMGTPCGGVKHHSKPKHHK